ncbi:MAG: hypothetical protein D4R88_07700, partial [Methanosarcinales archaeon]
PSINPLKICCGWGYVQQKKKGGLNMDIENIKNKALKISVTSEIKRIFKGYRSTSNAWYYHVLYDVCTLISVIKMSLCNIFRRKGL